MDWLLSPIDPARAHDVGFAVSWHARSMVLAWGVLAPLAVLIARYFKVLPGQDWPREVDSQLWWRSHWMGQGIVVMLSLFGLGLILGVAKGGSIHGLFGYVLLALMAAQVLLGVFRGSKGGPTDHRKNGDHYDMTPWRVMFEWCHKLIGYAALLLAMVVITLGLWQANAPRWMWLLIGIWWLVLIVISGIMQKQGRAIDTYQAIWGADPAHPGNRRAPIGWGISRYKQGETHVRHD